MEAIDFIDSFHGLLHCFMFLRIPQRKEFWVLHEFWIQMIARNSLHVAGKKFSFAVSRQKQIKKICYFFAGHGLLHASDRCSIFSPVSFWPDLSNTKPVETVCK